MMTEGANVFVCRIAQDYGRELLNLAYSRLGSREDAEDCVQEVFVTLLEKQPSFRNPTHEKAWLIRATINRAANMRAKTAGRDLPLDCGTVKEIRVGAGFVEACMDTRLPETDDSHAATLAQMEAVTAALADTSITYRDGHTETVSTLPSPWASPWVYANGEPDSCRVQHMLSQVLDLREIASVTLGGVTVPMQ